MEIPRAKKEAPLVRSPSWFLAWPMFSRCSWCTHDCYLCVQSFSLRTGCSMMHMMTASRSLGLARNFAFAEGTWFVDSRSPVPPMWHLAKLTSLYQSPRSNQNISRGVGLERTTYPYMIIQRPNPNWNFCSDPTPCLFFIVLPRKCRSFLQF